MRNRMYGGVRGRKTKVGEKLLRFPPTRLLSAFFAALTAIVSRVAPIDQLSVVNTLTSCIVIANRG